MNKKKRIPGAGPDPDSDDLLSLLFPGPNGPSTGPTGPCPEDDLSFGDRLSNFWDELSESDMRELINPIPYLSIEEMDALIRYDLSQRDFSDPNRIL